jgi:hypothetical protein
MIKERIKTKGTKEELKQVLDLFYKWGYSWSDNDRKLPKNCYSLYLDPNNIGHEITYMDNSPSEVEFYNNESSSNREVSINYILKVYRSPLYKVLNG